jgi:hypothetical protein
MPAVAKRKLSGSTNGRGILVAATATPGTTLHTARAETTDGTYDEVWLYVVNTSTSGVKLTVEFGGTTSPNDLVEYDVPGEDGLHLVVPGLLLQGGAIVRAFAAQPNLLVVHGFVHRIDA